MKVRFVAIATMLSAAVGAQVPRTARMPVPPAPTQASQSIDRRAHWPAVIRRVPGGAAIEAHIDRILSRMNVEEKVGQIIQADISAVTPDDVRRYKLGSILAGGNSSPGGNEKAPPADWLKLADAYWEASMAADWAGEKIPIFWGIDA